MALDPSITVIEGSSSTFSYTKGTCTTNSVVVNGEFAESVSASFTFTANLPTKTSQLTGMFFAMIIVGVIILKDIQIIGKKNVALAIDDHANFAHSFNTSYACDMAFEYQNSPTSQSDDGLYSLTITDVRVQAFPTDGSFAPGRSQWIELC